MNEDKKDSSRRFYGDFKVDRDNSMSGASKNAYNKNIMPVYQSTMKYNIITGAEQEDKLPPILNARSGMDPSANLVSKQKEYD